MIHTLYEVVKQPHIFVACFIALVSTIHILYSSCIMCYHLIYKQLNIYVQGVISSDNIDSWKRKLTTLMHDKDKQELVSREKQDRRDYEQIAALASKLGLYRYYYQRCWLVECLFIYFQVAFLL